MFFSGNAVVQPHRERGLVLEYVAQFYLVVGAFSVGHALDEVALLQE